MNFKAVVTSAGLLFLGCFETRVAEPDKEGSSSETIAYVKGKFVDANGHLVVGARTSLVPEKFNPMVDELPKTLEAVTNSNGEYVFETVKKGTYAIQASDTKNGIGFYALGKVFDKEVALGQDTLKATGTLKVTLGNDSTFTNGFIYLPQTLFAWQITSKASAQGFLEIEGLPPGKYSPLVYSKDTSILNSSTLMQNVNVVSGQVTLVDNLKAWLHQRVLTASYAEIKLTENIYAYPILLRLDSNNFNFNQAKSGFEDIRFSKMDGTPLAFEVEHVDGLRQSATIWVSLDTVPHSQDSLQFKMYWGNAKAVSRSDSRAVFGSLAGYVGTWHLNSTTSPSGLMSSFSNSADVQGQGFDSLVTSDVSGFSGQGHYFDGNDLIRVPNGLTGLNPKKGISIEVWFKANGAGISGSDLVSIGNNFGLRVLANGDVSVYSYTYPISEISSCMYNSTTHALDNDWHQLVGTLQGNRLDLYEDGMYKGGTNCEQGVPTFNGGPDLIFGAHGNGEPNFNFTGIMDEVRIYPGILPGKTIQLNFGLQKSLGAQLKLQ